MEPTSKTSNGRKARNMNTNKLEKMIDMLRAKGVTKFKSSEFEIELLPVQEQLRMEEAPTYTPRTPGAEVPSMWTPEQIEFFASDYEAELEGTGSGAD